MDIEELDFSTIKIIEPKVTELNKECKIELYKDIKKYIPYLRALGKISAIAENKIIDRINEEINL